MGTIIYGKSKEHALQQKRIYINRHIKIKYAFILSLLFNLTQAVYIYLNK